LQIKAKKITIFPFYINIYIYFILFFANNILTISKQLILHHFLYIHTFILSKTSFAMLKLPQTNSFFIFFGLLLYSLFPYLAFAQPKNVNLENLNHLINISQEGKTYYTTKVTANSPNAVYEPVGYQIKLSPPQYKEYLDTIVIAPALNGNLDTTNYFVQTEILVLKEPSMHWKEAQISKLCIANAKTTNTGVCLLKTTATYEIIHTRFYPFKNILDTTRTEYIIPAEIKIVKRYELTKPTQVAHFTLSEQVELKSNEKLITITEGYWIRWTEAVCPFGVFNDPDVKKIQEALVKQGYKLQKTGNFDEQTKRALYQFQIDNNLPEGDISPIVLNRLGIETEKLIQIID
jgi:Putative peptidoglycan binding domain